MKQNASCCNLSMIYKKNYNGWCSVEDEFRGLGKEAAPQSGGTAADTSVSFARWQQGEQTVAGVGVVFQYPLGPVQISHFTNQQ